MGMGWFSGLVTRKSQKRTNCRYGTLGSQRKRHQMNIQGQLVPDVNRLVYLLLLIFVFSLSTLPGTLAKRTATTVQPQRGIRSFRMAPTARDNNIIVLYS